MNGYELFITLALMAWHVRVQLVSARFSCEGISGLGFDGPLVLELLNPLSYGHPNDSVAGTWVGKQFTIPGSHIFPAAI